MVSIGQYSDREVEACKRVLVELIHILGEFKDEIVKTLEANHVADS